MHNNQKVEDMDDTHLSKEEIEALIRGLSEVDLFRLSKIAHQYIGGHDLDANDLLNEAITRGLTAGSRDSCPRSTSIVTFLAGIMRSIADAERKCLRNKNTDQFSDEEQDAIADSDLTTEQILLENEAYKALQAVFDDDEEILMLLLHLQDGASPAEIQEAENWSATQYNTIRRRLRRKWNAHTTLEKVS